MSKNTKYCSIIVEIPTGTWNEDGVWLLINKNNHQDSRFILVNNNAKNVHVHHG
jgi:hypothetical protein